MKENNVQIESWGPFAAGRNNMFQNELYMMILPRCSNQDEKENYESIEVGQREKITSGFNQLESLPPIRSVVIIEKINE
jgi:hypothetical protein